MKKSEKTIENNNEQIALKDILAYEIEFFKLMSSQRMQMFNFYISIIVILVGGFFALLQMNSINYFAQIIDVSLIMLVSCAFIGIDIRNRRAIDDIVRAIECVERKFRNTDMGVIHQAKKHTFNRMMTYTFWVNFLYSFIGIGAFILDIYLIIYSGWCM